AGEVERPRDGVRVGAADLLDGRALRFGEVLVPAELLEHPVVELRIAVLDLRTLGIGALRQQSDAVALDTEAGAERAAAVHDVQMRVVEQRRARMFDLGRAPAGPWQSVIVALTRPRRSQHGEEVEILLVRHVELEALRRLSAVAGRPAAAVHFAKDVLRDRK